MDEFQYATPIAQDRFNAKELGNRLTLVKEIPNANLTPVKETTKRSQNMGKQSHLNPKLIKA